MEIEPKIKMLGKFLVRGLAVFLLLFILWYRLEFQYAFGQLKGQVEIILNSEDIEHYMLDPDFSEEYKAKLRYVGMVKVFAEKSLGLNPSDNYTTVYDQKGEDILWNVTASEKFALIPYKWEFPIAGAFSYKGFFDRDKAIAEYKLKVKEGFDVSLRPVSAWSTLGIFRDPILSNMLDRSDEELAELVIHEMTHATLYVKDDISFNENLATFIGEKGAVLFLKEYFRDQPNRYIDYVKEKKGEKYWIKYIIGEANKLDSLYQAITHLVDVDKERLKADFLKEFIIDASFKRRYYGLGEVSLDSNTINNTYFLSYLRYHSSQECLDSMYRYQFNGDFADMLNYFEDLY